MGYFDNSLQHHGILGQKWGVRRFEKAGGGLTAAGRTRYQTDEEGNYKKLSEHKGLSDEQKEKLKKYAKIGAVVVGTSLAAYGGYKLYQLNKEATNGISAHQHEEAVTRLLDANHYSSLANDRVQAGAKWRSQGRTDISSKLFDDAKKYSDLAYDRREEGKAIAKMAKSKNYSLKEKADYLKKGHEDKKRFNQAQKQRKRTYKAIRDGKINKAVRKRTTPPPIPKDLKMKNLSINDLSKLDLY